MGTFTTRTPRCINKNTTTSTMAVTTLRQMPHTEIDDFFFYIQRFYLKNIISLSIETISTERIRLVSTITVWILPTSLRWQTSNTVTWWLEAYSILFTRFNLSPVLALVQSILSFSVTVALKSCLLNTDWRRVSWKESQEMVSITLKLQKFRGISVSYVWSIEMSD